MRETELYLFDTSFLHSLIIPKDTLNNRALEVLNNLEETSSFMIPYIVVTELLIAEAQDIDLINACKIFTKKFTSHDKTDLEFIRSIPASERRKLKANDCIILALCKRFDATLLTFDKQLEKMSLSI